MMASSIQSDTAAPILHGLKNAKMDKTESIQLPNKKPTISNLANMKKNPVNEEKEEHDPHHLRTLFVRFPCRVKDKEKVKLLYTGIEAVRFKPRINRWCHIRFVSEEIAKSALKELHKKEVENGKLIVSETKKCKITNPNKEMKDKNPKWYKLYISNLPDKVTVEEICSAFPGCRNVRIFTPKKPGKAIGALIGFRSLDKMKAIISDTKMHKVRNVDVRVSYTKSYLNANNLNKEQKPKSGSRMSKDISLHGETKHMLTSISSSKNIVNSAQKLTPKYLGKMVEASLSQLPKQENDIKEKSEKSEQVIKMDATYVENSEGDSDEDDSVDESSSEVEGMETDDTENSKNSDKKRKEGIEPVESGNENESENDDSAGNEFDDSNDDDDDDDDDDKDEDSDGDKDEDSDGDKDEDSDEDSDDNEDDDDNDDIDNDAGNNDSFSEEGGL